MGDITCFSWQHDFEMENQAAWDKNEYIYLSIEDKDGIRITETFK